MIKELIDKASSDISTHDLILLISRQEKIPVKIVKKGVKQGLLKINREVVRNLTSIPPNPEILYQNVLIVVSDKSRFDTFINLVLEEIVGHKELKDLYSDQEQTLFSHVLQYFSEFGYDVDELKNSEWNEPILNGLKVYSTNRGLIKKNEKRKDLIEDLEKSIAQSIHDIELVIEDFKGFDLREDRQLLNRLGRSLNSQYLVQLVYPLFSELKVDLFITGVKEAQLLAAEVEETEKIKRSEDLKKILSQNQSILNKHPELHIIKVFKGLVESIYRKSQEKVGDLDVGDPKIDLTSEDRTYDVQNFPIKVYVNIKNNGDGIARDIEISEGKGNVLYSIPILPSGQVRNFSFEVNKPMFIGSIDSKIELLVTFKSESGDIFTNQVFVEITPQNESLPWEDLKRTKPYVISVIKDRNKFFGREVLLDDLKWNIEESTIMSSYIIFGQKRIGKSSIIRTLEDMVRDNSKIIFCYKSIGSIKNATASKTFQKLASSLTKSVLSEYRKKHDIHYQYDFDLLQESLAELSDLIEELSMINPGLRFVIAIDEFDELNHEFFRDSVIGETLALNLGKGLNEFENVSILLVGSETMDTKSKQSMRLNTFESKKVDAFDKDTEFTEFSKVVTKPSEPCLEFDPRVIDWLYDYTSGNPYFTNLLCSAIFDRAYDIRKSYIDLEFARNEVNHAIKQFSKKEFEHFWIDGLSEEDEILYKKYLERRQRLLFAAAELLKEKNPCRWTNIRKRIKQPLDYKVTETQWDETFHEFLNRGIFKGDFQSIKIDPPLFQDWLTDDGLYKVVAEIENREQFIDKLNEEEALSLTDEEIHEIQKRCGDEVRYSQLRRFFNQIESIPQRRNIADLLKDILYISSDQLTSHLKATYSEIWTGTIKIRQGGKIQRTNAELISLDSSYNQNSKSYKLVREIFKFPSNKDLKRETDLQRINYSNLEHLIIYEPLIDCPHYYRNSIAHLLKKVNPEYVRGMTIHILAFVISDEAFHDLQELLTRHFAYNFKIHCPKTYQRNEISPYLNQTSIGDETWKAILNFSNYSSETSSFVKIGTIVPYQSFPFLWMKQSRKEPLINSNTSNQKDYERFVSISKGIQDLNLGSETKDREFKGSLAYPIRNHKEILNRTKKLKLAKEAESVEELKKSLRDIWKHSGSKKTPRIMHSIAKTLAAFYNTVGGDLYVGIEDDLTIIGLESDMNGKPFSEENIRSLFENICSEYLGNEFTTVFNEKFLSIGEFKVLKISVKKGNQQMWVRRDEDGKQLKESDYQFYIRRSQSSAKLSVQEMSGWMLNRN